MLSENPDQHGNQLVSISKDTLSEMVRRLGGLQNIELIVQEKDAEIKQLRGTVIMLQSKLMGPVVPGQEQATAVNTEFHTQTFSDHHRSSDPRIFHFSDVSKTSVENCESLIARGSSCKAGDSVKTNSKAKIIPPQYEAQKQSGTELGDKTSFKNYGISVNMDCLSINGRSDSSRCVGGVSQLYFNNVVSELVKTKQSLNSLQKQLKEKVNSKENAEDDALRQQIAQLVQQLSELKSQHAQTQRENVLLKIQNGSPEKTEKKGPNDSFEIEEKKMVETDTQTESLKVTSSEVQKLKLEIIRLTREKNVLEKEKSGMFLVPAEIQSLLTENDSLQQQLEQKTVLYNQQKESNKILTTCLQEEKIRYKQLSDQYRDLDKKSSKEIRGLLERMAHIRQKYEELRQENSALEKTQSLLDLSQAQSNRSTASNTSHRGHSRQPSDVSVHSSGSDYAIAPARIQPDSGSFQLLECPTCQQTYSIEKEYQIHISKCCVD